MLRCGLDERISEHCGVSDQSSGREATHVRESRARRPAPSAARPCRRGRKALRRNRRDSLPLALFPRRPPVPTRRPSVAPHGRAPCDCDRSRLVRAAPVVPADRSARRSSPQSSPSSTASRRASSRVAPTATSTLTTAPLRRRTASTSTGLTSNAPGSSTWTSSSVFRPPSTRLTSCSNESQTATRSAL